MYPISQYVADSLETFIRREHYQPEIFLEKGFRKRPSTRQIIKVYNHLVTTKQPHYRLTELANFFAELLEKDFFVPKNQPLIRSKRCFILHLPAELLHSLFEMVGMRGFMALAASCRGLFHTAYERVACNRGLLSKYVSRRLVTESKMKGLFLKSSYGTPTCVELSSGSVRSVNILSLFPCVEAVSLHSVKVDKKLICFLNALSHLRSLTIRNMSIANTELLQLAKHNSSLASLTLYHCTSFSKAGFSLNHPLMKLTQLDLTQMTLDDDDFAHILRCCPNVRTLLVSGCRYLTGISIRQARQLEFLEELNISSCDTLTDENYLAIIAQAKALKSLTVAHCRALTRNAFSQAEYSPTLTHFLAHWSEIDDTGLRKVLQLPRLEMLDVSNCFLITKNALIGLTALPPLKKFCLEGTSAEGLLM